MWFYSTCFVDVSSMVKAKGARSEECKGHSFCPAV